MQDALDLSILIPVRNEADSIGRLIVEVYNAMIPLSLRWEFIVVDDRSTDRTAEAIESCDGLGGPGIRLIRNAGQGKDDALATGFASACGKVVVTLDGDLQDDPAGIPGLLLALSTVDAVFGVRTPRQDPVAKRLVSIIANGVRQAIAADSTCDAGCGIKAIRKHCLPALVDATPSLYGFAHFFYAPILRARGYETAQMPVHHRPRAYGHSKFPAAPSRIVPGIRACLWVRRLLREARYELRTSSSRISV